MEVFNLNIIPGSVAPIIHASQYDDGREFRANLFEGPSVYTLTGAETITINVRKPDGNVVTAAVTNTADSYVEFATTEQMTACSGANLCELKFENSPVKIGSLNFILSVEADPLEGGIQSESAIHDLQAQIAAAVAEQYDAADVIFDAAPTPGHGVGFAVTSEGIATAVQDAKDYTDTAIGGLSIPDELNDLSDVTITTPSNGEILVYNNGTWENQANPASTTNFAPDYDDTATYNTNDKVIYQGLLYVCLEDSVTGAWDNTKWQQISVADLNAELLPIQSGSATNTKAYIDNSIPTRTDFIRYEDKTIGAVEFTNAYYLLPSGSRPTVPSGYMFLMGIMLDYGSIQSGTSAVVTIDQNGTYLFGIAGSKYSNVKVRYIYIKS